MRVYAANRSAPAHPVTTAILCGGGSDRGTRDSQRLRVWRGLDVRDPFPLALVRWLRDER